MQTNTAPASSASDVTAAPRVPALRIARVLAGRPVLILLLGLALLGANLSLIHANALVVIVDVIALVVVALAMRAEGRRLRDLFGPWRWMDLAWDASVHWSWWRWSSASSTPASPSPQRPMLLPRCSLLCSRA